MAVTVNHNRFYIKVLSMFCCVVLLLGFAKPPKSKAVATEAVILSAVATAFVVSCGYTFITGDTGVDDNAYVSSINSMVDKFSLEKFGKSALDFISSTSLMSGISLGDGKVLMNNKAAEYFADFAHWIQDTFSPIPGGAPVACTGSVHVVAGCPIYLPSCGSSEIRDGKFSVPIDGWYALDLSSAAVGSKVFPFEGHDDIFFKKWKETCCFLQFNASTSRDKHADIFTCKPRFYALVGRVNSDGSTSFHLRSSRYAEVGCGSEVDNNIYCHFPADYWLSVQTRAVNAGMKVLAGNVHYPQAKEMEKDEELAIAVPALEGESDLADAINKAAAAGTLAATHAITKAGEVVDTGEIQDVKDLGLPSLSVAFTTRFPFSIPWDVARGIKLLAVPPKAPYWKVDFMKPLSAKVGGFKGSTAIEIDMSEYEIIGQVSRWTSTIGFCLMLAMGTKKISWIG